MRMDVISSNMANVDTTRGKMVDGEWQPYRRKMVSLQPREGQFSSMLNASMGRQIKGSAGYGVKVSSIQEILKHHLNLSLILAIQMRMKKVTLKCRTLTHCGK